MVKKEWFNDGNGGHCLVGALLHLCRKHRLPTAPAIALLQDAMPRPGLPLVYFNDTRCGSVAEPRSVILRTRGLAHDDVERERAAAAVKTWLLGQTEKNEPRRRLTPGKRRPTRYSPPYASPPNYRRQPPRVGQRRDRHLLEWERQLPCLASRCAREAKLSQAGHRRAQREQEYGRGRHYPDVTFSPGTNGSNLVRSRGESV